MTEKIFTREFVLAFVAQTVFLSVIQLLIPTLPIYLARMGSTEVEIGVFVGVFGITSVFLRPLVGRALVTIPEKKFMLAAALLSTVTAIVYLVASSYGSLFVARVLQGVAFAMFHTATFTLVANMNSGGHRAQRISYFTLAINFSAAIAPPVGMFLINRFSFSHLFAVCAGLSLCSLFFSQALPPKQVDPLPDVAREKGSFLNWEAVPPSVVSCLSFFIWGAVSAFFPLYAMERGMTNPGLFFTTVAVMMLLCRSLGARLLELTSSANVIVGCLSLCIASMAIMGFSRTLPLFLVAALFWGAGHAFLLPSLMDYILSRSDTPSGPLMGTFTAVTDLGQFLGPLTMGIVLHYTTYPVMFFSLAIVGFLNLNYFYFLVRGRR